MTISSNSKTITELTTLELAQLLAEKMTISSYDWHKQKNNRKAQAGQQLASSLVFLLNNQPEEALERINQAQGWLNKTINPLPCPSHGDRHNS
ncbi:hypothetical protein IQ215_09880 [Cyanobacterium stanieri LEGE 03274]|uniref:Uncharacterized protein n=1 Tax=Cyanobacterium stanieri LEGE 03274 TaxID=1828756 RepID=A0ABR9V542_9CHRO|nr:DUF6439 family protein [Cyanobacterium stanieri]MBE9223002.1 hypothetical protein [Cyanobacterium stanieri LEGE 03274]